MIFPLLSLPGITGVCSTLVAFYISARGLHAHAANTLALLHTETAPQPFLVVKVSLELQKRTSLFRDNILYSLGGIYI